MLSEGHVKTLTVLFPCPHGQSHSLPSLQKNLRTRCVLSWIKSPLLPSLPMHYKGSGPPCWRVGVGSGQPVLSGKVQGQRRERLWTRGGWGTHGGELP